MGFVPTESMAGGRHLWGRWQWNRGSGAACLSTDAESPTRNTEAGSLERRAQEYAFPPPPANVTGYLDTATAGNYSNKRKFPRAGLNVVLSGYVETINAYWLMDWMNKFITDEVEPESLIAIPALLPPLLSSQDILSSTARTSAVIWRIRRRQEERGGDKQKMTIEIAPWDALGSIQPPPAFPKKRQIDIPSPPASSTAYAWLKVIYGSFPDSASEQESWH